MTETDITIFGVGAMATLFGCFLSRIPSRARITLFGTWRDQINRLKTQDVIFRQIDGTEISCRLRATNNLDHIGETDIALILVKSHQTAKVAKQAAAVLRKDGFAVTLQNGIGNNEILREYLGENRTVLGSTMQAAYLIAPGQVYHGGEGVTYLESGAEFGGRVESLAAIFRKSGIETQLVPNAQRLIWQKLVVNAAINPLAALLEVTNGKLLENAGVTQVMAQTVREVVAVAEAQGIDLQIANPVAHVQQVCRATAKNISSMLQDIRRGVRTEIDAISGAIVRLGKSHAVPTPVNEFLYDQVKKKEKGLHFDAKMLFHWVSEHKGLILRQ